MQDDGDHQAEKTAAALHLGHRKRLRQRFLAAPESLPDYEIVEMLLFAAKSRADTKPLAKLLLARFGDIARLLAADPAALRHVAREEGDGVVAAIKVAHEMARRMLRAELKERPIIGSWQSVLDYCQVAMGHLSIEQFRILFLDRRNALIADECHQQGTVDHTPVYPREVVKRALELSASSVILIHNHPSGDPTPSPADITMTRAVRDAVKAVGIVLHDHVIIAGARHISFRTLNLL